MEVVGQWALHIIQAIFVVMAAGVFVTYRASLFLPYLIAALIYGGAALASFMMGSWWPLLIGFALTVIMKFVGLDPSGRR